MIISALDVGYTHTCILTLLTCNLCFTIFYFPLVVCCFRLKCAHIFVLYTVMWLIIYILHDEISMHTICKRYVIQDISWFGNFPQNVLGTQSLFWFLDSNRPFFLVKPFVSLLCWEMKLSCFTQWMTFIWLITCWSFLARVRVQTSNFGIWASETT